MNRKLMSFSRIVLALAFIVTAFFTQIAAFDVFETNAAYLYLIVVGFLLLQIIIVILLLKMRSHRLYSIVGAVICGLLLFWNMLLSISSLLQHKPCGLNIACMIGYLFMLIVMARQAACWSNRHSE